MFAYTYVNISYVCVYVESVRVECATRARMQWRIKYYKIVCASFTLSSPRRAISFIFFCGGPALLSRAHLLSFFSPSHFVKIKKNIDRRSSLAVAQLACCLRCRPCWLAGWHAGPNLFVHIRPGSHSALYTKCTAWRGTITNIICISSHNHRITNTYKHTHKRIPSTAHCRLQGSMLLLLLPLLLLYCVCF